MTAPEPGAGTAAVGAGPPSAGTSDVVARPRSASPPSAPELEARVWSALAEIPDPELPLVSVVDLGLIGRVHASTGRIHVELLPTFVGCHALEVIQGAIADRLARLAPAVVVEPVFDPPWTSDRITAEGRRRLTTMGVAPPGSASGPAGAVITLDAAVPCPLCGSKRTRLENTFGPTQCRTIRYCLACRNPFEAFKTI